MGGKTQASPERGIQPQMFIFEDPRLSERERNLQRSRATSFAATKSYYARRKSRGVNASQARYSLRSSGPLSHTIDHTDPPDKETSIPQRCHRSTTRPATVATDSNDMVLKLDPMALHERPTEAARSNKSCPSPDLGVLQFGSSDPFSCLPLEVCPVTNYMITFTRDAVLPAFFRSCLFGSRTTQRELRITEAMGRRFVQRIGQLNILRPATAATWVSIFIPTIASFLPDRGRQWSAFQTTTLKLRARALNSVRQSIAQLQYCPSTRIQVLAQVACLFAHECAARNPDGARVHAKTMQYLGIDTPVMETAVRLLVRTLYSDLELSCFSFQHTLIDYDTYIPQQVPMFWTKHHRLVESMIPKASYQIHSCIADPLVKDAISHIRQSLALADVALPMECEKDMESIDTIYDWMVSNLLCDVMLLLNHTVVSLKSSQSVHDGEVATKLTTLILLIHYTQRTIINGTDIRDSSHIMISKLREHLQRSEGTTVRHMTLDCNQDQSDPSRSSSPVNNELLFWIYFVGSYFEIRHNHSQCTAIKRPAQISNCQKFLFFRNRLALQASRLGLAQWPRARKVLQRFVYSDELTQPNPEMWYEKVISVWE